MSYKDWPYGMFSDSTTQRVLNVANAQAVAFNTDETKYRITHNTAVNNSRIYIDIAGTYLITVSGIADLSAGANEHLHLWLAVDGTNVARSNTIVQIPTASTEMVIMVSYLQSFTYNQYFEIIMWGTSTNVGIFATAAGVSPTRPACPSIILTVNRVK